uniref:NADH dehydrogenase subunit 3 n=1 Tax=Amritodus flavoscutatus TaxID=2479863 RepID=UPI002E76EE69|nr:NADH dehydrogenase subunit 3 [Amritodus flavoscutatus]WQF70193.1 NADH dehydrogenase subunit 3 [Amritodus flavoscutatus]
MYLVMIMFTVILVLILMILLLLIFVSFKTIIDTQKLTPFECGFNPMSNKRMPFSIHFFMIAVIFLIFDIEIIIIVPMINTLNYTLAKYWLFTSLTFIIVLMLGLYHEWFNGMLNWTN